MKISKLTMIGAAAMVCSMSLPAYAATDAECQSMWTKADANNDGYVTDAEAAPYLAAMRVTERKMGADGRLDKASFMDACKNDVYTHRKADAGAPLKGKNSFTEGQARDRAVAQGFSNVAGLKKDDDGIWRGTAMGDGKSVQVAIDYKGNVVSTAAP